MCAARDDLGATQVPSQRAFPPATAITQSGQWFNQLNSQGPGASPIPFVDNAPPFYLQRAPAEGISPQPMPTDQPSSRPGQAPQPAPLSHSLLSRLELSENDPNTFRDIIDDLTVQNKNLKRQLRRYERDRSLGMAHNGCFEVRVQHLSPDKKQELEGILQRFASTIPPVPYVSEDGSIPSNAHSHQQPFAPTHKPSPSPSLYTKGLDSAYASISAAGMTNKTTSLPNGKASIRPRKGGWLPTNDYEQQPKLVREISDCSKQREIVHRLEQLFQDGFARRESSPQNGTANASPQPADRNDQLAPRQKGASVAQADEATSSVTANSTQHDFQYAQQEQQDAVPFPRDLQSSQEVGRPFDQGSDAVDPDFHGPIGQQLGTASPISTSTPNSGYEWVYLNLLGNMAQLHLFNVTPEFVRAAIHEISVRLVLSDDGRKVRWRDNTEMNTISQNELLKPTVAGALVASPIHLEEQPINDPPKEVNDATIEQLERARPQISPNSRDIRLSGSADPPPVPLSSKWKTPKKPYKPMFRHSKRRLRRIDQDDSASLDSSSSPSSAEETPEIADVSSNALENPQNGRMIFFNRDPFFLDLSADAPKTNRNNGPLYESLTPKPFGERQQSNDHSPDTETRMVWSFPENDPPELVRREGSHRSTPPLTVHEDIATFKQEENDQRHERIHFEASGIGGVQPDDNFAIDVHTQISPTSPSQVPMKRSPPSRILHSPPKHVRQSHYQTQILSTKTTHLPPSPLPPPSYVYPTALTESDSEDDDDNSDGMSTSSLEGSEDLQFCNISISHQSLHSEHSSPSSQPGNGDEDDI
ncbi:MAG: hypothetical protein Q9174_004987 [Haloplaca sp. 1 TL-2023]